MRTGYLGKGEGASNATGSGRELEMKRLVDSWRSRYGGHRSYHTRAEDDREEGDSVENVGHVGVAGEETSTVG